MVHTGSRLQQHAKSCSSFGRCQRRLVVDAELGQRLGKIDSSIHVYPIQSAKKTFPNGTQLHTFRRITPLHNGASTFHYEQAAFGESSEVLLCFGKLFNRPSK